MKQIFFIILICFAVSNLHSQDTAKVSPWKYGATVGMSFTQVALSNWTGGGKNTIAISGAFGANSSYSAHNTDWTNSLDVGYGLTKLGEEDFRKSDDKLIFISKLGHKATGNLNYSALLDFRTQFNYGYNFDKLDSNNRYTKISAFMAPAFVNLGLGMNYKPVEYLSLMLSPIANRLIIVLDEDLSNLGAFGVDKGKKMKSELGSSFNANFKKEVLTNVVLQSRLNLFSPFNNFTKAVVNWETLVNMKINSFLTASLAADVIYDEKVKVIRDDGSKGPATQFRNVLSIGFSYVLK